MKINEAFLNAKTKAYPYSKPFTYLYFGTFTVGIAYLTYYLIYGISTVTTSSYIDQILFSFFLMTFWFVLGIFSLEIEKSFIKPIPHVFIGFVFFLLSMKYEWPSKYSTDYTPKEIAYSNLHSKINGEYFGRKEMFVKHLIDRLETKLQQVNNISQETSLQDLPNEDWNYLMWKK